MKKLLLKIYTILMVMVVFSSGPLASALSAEQKKVIDSNIGYFNVKADACLGTTASSPAGAVVVIDPGHSGPANLVATTETDPVTGIESIDNDGAPGERQAMWDTAQLMQAALTAAGYKVMLTKTGVDDEVGLLTRAKIANDAQAAVAVSLHYSAGTFGQPNDHFGVTPQEVGLFRENKSNSTRKTFDNAAVAQKSKDYAQKIADARTATGDVTKVVPLDTSFPQDRPDIKAWGNISIVQLFSNVPWVYNETGQTGFDKQKYADGIVNGIKAALPDSGSSACCTSTLSGSDNMPAIYNYLVGKGLQPFQVAGILGNMKSESHFEPRLVQYGKLNSRGEVSVAGQPSSLDDIPPAGDKTGYGIVQFTPGTKLLSASADIVKGRPPGDLTFQLDFLWNQFQTNEKAAYDAIVATTNVADATVAFETKYERHAGDPQPQRIVDAQQFLDTINAGGVAGGGSGCGGQGLAAKVTAYAWPDYRARDTAGALDMKPEYAAAVATAQTARRYVGGVDADGNTPGIDCGGFVTTLMIDSGFEPHYNNDGLLAQGANNVGNGQKPWLDANWQQLGSITSSSQLQPGDVAIFKDLSHTYVFVGQIPGFGSVTASSSLHHRAPMASPDDVTSSDILWYRKR